MIKPLFIVGVPRFLLHMWVILAPPSQQQQQQLPILPLMKQEAPILINPLTKKICLEAQPECWRTILSTEEITLLKRAYLISGEA
jgi:hypothetical protein